jgi:DNA repair protein RadC
MEASAWRDGPADGTLATAVARQDAVCVWCSAESARLRTLADIEERAQITSPECAAEIVLPELAARDRERCLGLLLDTKHRLIEVVTVSVGSVDHTFMSPREVFRDALVANASALVLSHNHPSGDPEPSRDDELVTRRLVRAGEVVGVDVLDHLVVGGQRWVSLARRGVV